MNARLVPVGLSALVVRVNHQVLSLVLRLLVHGSLHVPPERWQECVPHHTQLLLERLAVGLEEPHARDFKQVENDLRLVLGVPHREERRQVREEPADVGLAELQREEDQGVHLDSHDRGGDGLSLAGARVHAEAALLNELPLVAADVRHRSYLREEHHVAGGDEAHCDLLEAQLRQLEVETVVDVDQPVYEHLIARLLVLILRSAEEFVVGEARDDLVDGEAQHLRSVGELAV